MLFLADLDAADRVGDAIGDAGTATVRPVERAVDAPTAVHREVARDTSSGIGKWLPWLLLAGLVAGVAWAGPWRRHRIGPSAVVAAITMVVLGADVLVSSRLGLVSVLGLQPVTAGRFYGQGNVGFGVMLGCLLVVCAAGNDATTVPPSTWAARENAL